MFWGLGFRGFGFSVFSAFWVPARSLQFGVKVSKLPAHGLVGSRVKIKDFRLVPLGFGVF